MRHFPKFSARAVFLGLVGIALAAVIGFAATPPALAQNSDLQTLIQRLARMQEDLRILQKDYYRGQKTGAARLSSGRTGGPSGSGRLAGAEIRMSNLETAMRQLTGQLEEVRHNMQIMLQRLDGLVRDVDFRLTEIESRQAKALAATKGVVGQGAAGQGAAGPVGDGGENQPAKAAGSENAAAAGPPSSDLPRGTPIERYNYAYSLLTKMRLEEAEAAFRDFLDVYGDDVLAGNAQYWLGETYYARENMAAAARAFLIGIQRYPNSKKAPDTMLKLGIALARLGKAEDACAAFLEMRDKYPNLRSQVRKRMLKEMKAGDCN